MELQVVDIKGEATGSAVTLAESVFGVEANDHAIYLDVKQYLANQRQGTHKTKDKSEIVGSTRKLKKQKGTGTARAGSIKSGVFRGGGRFFGPKPRNYSFKLNKKLKDVAKRSALSYKAKSKEIILLEDVSFAAPKTKDFLALTTALNVVDSKTLFVLGNEDKNFYLSSRNLKSSQVMNVADVNTYAVLNAEKLVLTASAATKLNELLG
jgi:large subunit ribosomal protein L4